MQALVRHILLSSVRIYFREISVSGELDARPNQPTLIVANHPNGLLDPMVVQLALNRRVRFLAKSTLFENVFGRIPSLAFGAIPVYRKKDGQDTAKNDSMFSAVYDAFKNNAWVLIFPEGSSHDETQLLPLKTGAARMAIGAELENLQILPIGITYETKHHFRSRVNVNLGKTVQWAALRNEKRVRELTDLIFEGLRDAMFETPSASLRQGFFFVARWLEDDAPIAKLEEKAKELESAYGKLLIDNPESAQQLTEDISDFSRDLQSVGLEPWNLETTSSIKGLAFLIVFAPFAFIGFVTHIPVYMLIRFIVNRMSKGELDLLGTFKTIGGLIFYPLSWILFGLLFAYLFTWEVGLITAILLVPLAFFTLGYFERFNQRRRALSHFWLTRVTPALASEIRGTRDQLVGRISQLLERYERLE